jgi:Domain of unknown function (DUF4159)
MNSVSDELTRRSFVQQVIRDGAILTAVGSSFSPGSLFAAEENSGPVDCGPPKRAKPQRRKAGESFPPLPLPVTPLRRTERKRPPAPPALVAKMALGETRFRTVNGKRVAYRDWMTDPGDIDSLLSWLNQKLGIRYRPVEGDFTHFSYDPREIPAILLAGHQSFHLGEEVQRSLARYVLDGGTIIGDACCGWKDFDNAFQTQVNALLPGRRLRRLEPDDPLLGAYYRLGDFKYQRADGSRYVDRPCIEGIYVGCRLGVLYSPIDLTCGWDNHDHPRGKRVVIDQARQIGANYISYLLGSFQLGRFLSSTKVYHEKKAPDRDAFVMGQIVHDGDWDPDPSAVYNLLKAARQSSTINVKFKREDVRLSERRALAHPVLYMTGHHDFRFKKEEVARLRGYLKAGGLLFADACCGRLSFDGAFRREIRRVLPDSRLKMLPADHPVYHTLYDIKQVSYSPLVERDLGRLTKPTLEGISIDGKLAVLYSRFDLGDGWEMFPHPFSRGYSSKDALKIGVNALVYALTH